MVNVTWENRRRGTDTILMIKVDIVSESGGQLNLLKSTGLQETSVVNSVSLRMNYIEDIM